MDEAQPEAGTPVSLSAIGHAMGMEAKLQRLRRWAAERGIAGDDWMISALIAAALDHPDIREEKRKRGRPRKQRLGALPSLTKCQKEGDRLLHRVSQIHGLILLEGREPISDAEALRLLCQLDKRSPGRIPDEVRRTKTLLSNARKRHRVSKLVK